MAQRMAVAHAQVVPTTVTDDVNIDAWSRDTGHYDPARASHRGSLQGGAIA